jgi:hypothetical protein
MNKLSCKISRSFICDVDPYAVMILLFSTLTEEY